MLSDERILEIAEMYKDNPYPVQDHNYAVLSFARAIEAECRLPQIDGLSYALGVLHNAPLAYEFRVLREAATAYLKASKGE